MPGPTILVPYPAPDYVAALEQAGAQVRTVDASTAVEAALAGVDGVLLTGGADIDPSIYDAPRHPATQDAEPGSAPTCGDDDLDQFQGWLKGLTQ